ncbi:hypothetical protein [Arthrobacter sp. STN4]|uniref:hypothetical protein n=1 Tax=Arthrobacter sp. STN4 TaxID=2923276 RepID=UPI00211A30FE|nr:hypothetical protein [Arthrobacter sp. STN4]MCQ9166147.1 hypothetical protein [Arthrobacter sp. STN4]
MGTKDKNQKFYTVLAFATAAALITLSACTASQPSPNESDVPVQSSASHTPVASLDSGIIPHATGDSLEFECANPIAVGPTATGLGGSDGKPGVPDLLFIATAGTGADATPWSDGATAEGLHFQKMGLIMKAGTAFTISVPLEMRNSMKIGWSNSGYTIANKLTVSDCTSNQDNADWLVYPGGFWLKEPGCISLVVTKGQTSQTIHIPIGKTCP